MVDARRQEVYYGLYHVQAQGLRQTTAHQVASPAAVMAQMQKPCYFLGTGARMYQQLISDSLGSGASFSEADLDRINSAVIARLARADFQNQKDQALPVVTPVYIRRSDAEITAGKPASV
jgi:tRNA A37 threonylcarbamoyladenosine modification protein TsaB